MDDIKFMADLMADTNSNKGLIDADMALILQSVFNEYKKSEANVGDTILCFNMGKYGFIETYVIESFCSGVSEIQINYPVDSYDRADIIVRNNELILITDYHNIEPFNRSGSLYVGVGFQGLVLKKSEPEYREFNYAKSSKYSTSIPMQGFKYNKYLQIVSFDMCISTDQAPEVIEKLRKIIGK